MIPPRISDERSTKPPALIVMFGNCWNLHISVTILAKMIHFQHFNPVLLAQISIDKSRRSEKATSLNRQRELAHADLHANQIAQKFIYCQSVELGGSIESMQENLFSVYGWRSHTPDDLTARVELIAAGARNREFISFPLLSNLASIIVFQDFRFHLLGSSRFCGSLVA